MSKEFQPHPRPLSNITNMPPENWTAPVQPSFSSYYPSIGVPIYGNNGYMEIPNPMADYAYDNASYPPMMAYDPLMFYTQQGGFDNYNMCNYPVPFHQPSPPTSPLQSAPQPILPPTATKLQSISTNSSEPCACLHCNAARNGCTTASQTPVKVASFDTPHGRLNEKSLLTPDQEYRPDDADCEGGETPTIADPAILLVGTPQRAPLTPTHHRNSKITPISSRRTRHYRESHESSTYKSAAPRMAHPCFVKVQSHLGTWTCSCPFKVSVGEHVIFDGDRGEDLGEVTAFVAEPSTSNKREHHATVTRVADQRDIALWEDLRTSALSATEACNVCVEKLGLPLRITKSGYQFDRKKLTFFYDNLNNGARVDFRALLHEMYGAFRCRIWMERDDELTN